MGTYCTVDDVKQQIQIDATNPEMDNDGIELRITEAETWVNGEQDTTYSAPIPDLIKYATAAYAGGLVMAYLYTATEPNESSQSKELMMRAKRYLKDYTKASYEPESGMEKINSDFFDTDTG